MTRKPPWPTVPPAPPPRRSTKPTYEPKTPLDWAVTAGLLRSERDAARAEIERLRSELCDACRSREAKRDG